MAIEGIIRLVQEGVAASGVVPVVPTRVPQARDRSRLLFELGRPVMLLPSGGMYPVENMNVQDPAKTRLPSQAGGESQGSHKTDVDVQ